MFTCVFVPVFTSCSFWTLLINRYSSYQWIRLYLYNLLYNPGIDLTITMPTMSRSITSFWLLFRRLNEVYSPNSLKVTRMDKTSEEIQWIQRMKRCDNNKDETLIRVWIKCSTLLWPIQCCLILSTTFSLVEALRTWFSVWGNYRKNYKDLFIIFVHLTKAFGNASRDAL